MADLPPLGKTRVEIDANIKKLEADLKKLRGTTTKAATKMEGALGRVRIAIARIRNVTLLTKFALAATFYTAIRIIKSLTNAYFEQERAEVLLANRIRSTAAAAGYAASELKLMASELQKITIHGDEAIMPMMSMLLTFTELNREIFPQATMAVLNLSEELGGLKTASVMVGKALNDPAIGLTALQRVGIRLRDSQRDIINDLMEMNDVAGAQKVLLAELEVQYGGTAVAARQAAEGGLRALSMEFGDLKEKMGKLLVKAFLPFINQLYLLFAIINDLSPAVSKLKVLRDSFEVIMKYPSNTLEGMLQDANNLKQLFLDIGKLRAERIEAGAGETEIGRINEFARNVFRAYSDLNKSIKGLKIALPGKIAFPGMTPEEIPIDTSWLERWGEIYRQNLTDSEKLAFGIAHLNEVMSEGHMSTELYNREWKRLQEEFGETAEKVDKATKKINQFAIQAARNIQTAFADFLFDPFEKGLQGMLESFINILRRMVAEMMALKILFAIFGGVGGLGGFLGGILPMGASASGGTQDPVGSSDIKVYIGNRQVSSIVRERNLFDKRRSIE